MLNLIKKTGSLHKAFSYGDLIGSECMSTEKVNIKPLAPPCITSWLTGPVIYWVHPSPIISSCQFIFIILRKYYVIFTRKQNSGQTQRMKALCWDTIMIATEGRLFPADRATVTHSSAQTIWDGMCAVVAFLQAHVMILHMFSLK